MSEANTVTPIQNKMTFNQAMIQGKIESKRNISTQQGKLYLTVLKLAATDQYSHPMTIELRSSDPLGEVDDTITVKVQLGGLPNNYETKSIDRQTGEEVKTRVRSARNEYTVIAK